MPGSEGHSRKIRFGAYELDEAARELRKNGLSVRLQDQPWEVLLALLERPGEVVSREDLQRRLWPDGTFVDYEQSLNKAVNKLRDALCDSADRPRYVVTVARRGYRFVAPVELEGPKEVPAPIIQAARSHRRTGWGAGALGLVVGILVTGLWPVPAPRTRVTQLTHGGRLQSGFLAVHGGRILYTSEGEQSPNQAAAQIWTEFWSISTDGGEPKREKMTFLNPEYEAWLRLADSRQGGILVGARAAGATRGKMWLAGFDGSKPRPIGEYVADSNYSVSPDLKTLLRAGKEGLFARPV
ncbi:MAG: winged helix-turn-helix domain-containing protein, partial [Bryobacteraceae bacterium]